MIYNAPHWWYTATGCGWYTRLRRDWDATMRKTLEFPWKIWYNTLKEVIWNEESKYFTTYSLHLFTDWQYYKSVEFIDRDSICTLRLYRTTSLDIGDLIRYCHCQTDKERKKQKEIILIGVIGHLLLVFSPVQTPFTTFLFGRGRKLWETSCGIPLCVVPQTMALLKKWKMKDFWNRLAKRKMGILHKLVI